MVAFIFKSLIVILNNIKGVYHMKKVIIIFSIVLIGVLQGCSHEKSMKESNATNNNIEGGSLSGSQNNEKKTPTEYPSPIEHPSPTQYPTPMIIDSCKGEPIKNIDMISLDDFDVEYMGMVLNQNTSLEDLGKILNINLSEGDNIEQKAGSFIDGLPYSWNILHYPSAENEEITIEYAINDKDGSGRIVYIDLKQNPTKRGVQVGDSIDKVKMKYGESLDASFEFKEDETIVISYEDFLIYITYGINNKKVKKITIDYNTNKLLDEMGF